MAAPTLPKGLSFNLGIDASIVTNKPSEKLSELLNNCTKYFAPIGAFHALIRLSSLSEQPTLNALVYPVALVSIACLCTNSLKKQVSPLTKISDVFANTVTLHGVTTCFYLTNHFVVELHQK
ncbi:MAG: hypothetical protein AAGI90_03070 [Chlamydiota bacterium]